MENEHSHRAYEAASYIDDAIDTPTGDFRTDFEQLIRWSVADISNERDHRCAIGMPPEPYRYQSSSSGDALPEELIAHAEQMVSDAYPSWQWLYERMHDADSRNMLFTVLAYRAIGWKHVKMPLDCAAFWARLTELSNIQKSIEKAGQLPTNVNGIMLSKFDLKDFDFDIEIFSDAFGVFNEFLYSQYVYRGRDVTIGCQPGDYALDCGACFGGTSVFFADRVGPNGKVFSFEFFPGNVDVYNRNIALNPRLADRIELVKHPVWSDDGTEVVIEGSGPATQVHARPAKKVKFSRRLREMLGLRKKRAAELSFRTVAIDHLVESRGLPRLDFIKMDIEGAELTALRGARQTIERFKPSMAICVYHRLFDFYEIPQFLDGLGLGYKFYLQHSTVHGDETVLFADARH